mmetsp:Transcript_15604/g.52254  ORF Transcript_15604/g.52254 Transcript_15604/m.52254 type:complete len:316 (+) Transcript_15604:530-1477(+)
MQVVAPHVLLQSLHPPPLLLRLVDPLAQVLLHVVVPALHALHPLLQLSRLGLELPLKVCDVSLQILRPFLHPPLQQLLLVPPVHCKRPPQRGVFGCHPSSDLSSLPRPRCDQIPEVPLQVILRLMEERLQLSHSPIGRGCKVVNEVENVAQSVPDELDGVDVILVDLIHISVLVSERSALFILDALQGGIEGGELGQEGGSARLLCLRVVGQDRRVHRGDGSLELRNNLRDGSRLLLLQSLLAAADPLLDPLELRPQRRERCSPVVPPFLHLPVHRTKLLVLHAHVVGLLGGSELDAIAEAREQGVGGSVKGGED